MTQVLLTGAAGFVGHHMLARILADTDWHVICPVSYRHHGDGARINDVLAAHLDQRHRVEVFPHDLALPITAAMREDIGPVDYILNIASESHVDRAITNPGPFVRNNVEVMLNTLEFARHVKPRVVLHMGTDEEYGPAPGGYAHTEWDTVLPSNPYSASKAAQSALATAWWRTYQVPVLLTRTMNLISPGQDAEKFVPMVIRKILSGDTVQIHSSPDGEPGSRHWIDAREFAGAWLHLLDRAPVQMYPEHDRPSMYHVVGEERSNLEIAQAIARILGQPLKYDLVSFHESRPGHDLRYALDGSKLADLGWRPRRPLEETLADIVAWYLDHPGFLRSGEAVAA